MCCFPLAVAVALALASLDSSRLCEHPLNRLAQSPRRLRRHRNAQTGSQRPALTSVSMMRLELGTRLEELDVAVCLDLFGQLGVGIHHLAEENGGAAEITSRQAIPARSEKVSRRRSTRATRRASIRAALRQPSARLEAGTVLGISRAMRAAWS